MDRQAARRLFGVPSSTRPRLGRAIGKRRIPAAEEGARVGISFPSNADQRPHFRRSADRHPRTTAANGRGRPISPLGSWHLVADLNARLGWLPLREFVFDASRSREYLVAANWALYCDNYLEGFHIPFVHTALSAELDYGAYRTELFRYANVQIGIARSGEATFDLPASSPDHGQDVAGYYFWMFPNLMLNFYPWGLSVNIVKPLAVDRTRVCYLTYVWDASRLDAGAGAGLDRVEREDEAIVETVQRGVRSRHYDRGRYSPTREQGVHHFHRLLCEFLNEPRP